MIAKLFPRKKSKPALLACFVAAALCACSGPDTLEQASEKALAASKDAKSDAFLNYLDLEKIRENFIKRGYSPILLDSPAGPANPSIIAMLLGGRDIDEQINLYYVRNATDDSGEFIIQCINNPKNSMKFVYAKENGKWVITDYESLGDPEDPYTPPALRSELRPGQP